VVKEVVDLYPRSVFNSLFSLSYMYEDISTFQVQHINLTCIFFFVIQYSLGVALLLSFINNCSLGVDILYIVQLRNVLGMMRRGGNLRFEVSFISN
jgi:hypothetical protein